MSAEQWLAAIRRGRRGWSDALELLGFDGDRTAPCRALSLGNLRKIFIADALTAAVDVILLDEATMGLDDRGRSALVELVAAAARRGTAVMQAEQDAEPVPLADRTWRVHNGSVRTVIEGDMVAIALTGPRPAAAVARRRPPRGIRS